MSGESWQDRISSGGVGDNKDGPAVGSVEPAKKSGGDWQDRIGSGVKKEADAPTIASELNTEQQQDLQTLSLRFLSNRNGWPKKRVENRRIFRRKHMKVKI